MALGGRVRPGQGSWLTQLEPGRCGGRFCAPAPSVPPPRQGQLPCHLRSQYPIAPGSGGFRLGRGGGGCGFIINRPNSQGTILAPVTAWRRLPCSSGTWPLDILACSATRWPPGRERRTNERTIRAHERADETAPPGHGPAHHGDHCGHGRSQRSRPAATEIRTGVTAPASRTRRARNSSRCARRRQDMT